MERLHLVYSRKIKTVEVSNAQEHPLFCGRYRLAGPDILRNLICNGAAEADDCLDEKRLEGRWSWVFVPIRRGGRNREEARD